MLKKIFLVLTAALSLICIDVASANSANNNYNRDKVKVCFVEHGTSQTVLVNKNDVERFLKRYSKSYLGVCVETPPVVVPVVPPTVSVALPQNAALCYSAWQVTPGWWEISYAQKLFNSGYTAPVAVLGNVTGGENVGAYHLTCQKGTLKPTGSFVGGSGGATFGPEYTSLALVTAGFYPIVT